MSGIIIKPDEATAPKVTIRLEVTGGGGGSGGVSSWNDLTDKPFGEVTADDYLLPETTVEVITNDGAAILPELVANMTPGQVYKITYNGVAYDCVAQDGASVVEGLPGFLLGNVGALLGESGTGEPFIISCSNPGTAEGSNSMLVLDGSAAVTVSIYGTMEKIVTLPEKYIPDISTTIYFLEITNADSGYVISNGSFAEAVEAFNAKRPVYIRNNADDVADGAVLYKVRGNEVYFLGHDYIGNSSESVWRVHIVRVSNDDSVIVKKAAIAASITELT